MKQHILLIAMILLSISGITWADNLSGLGLNYYETDLMSYKLGELIVRFADVDLTSKLTDGPELIGPLSTRAVKGAISDFILTGSAVKKEYGEVAPGLAVVKLPEGITVTEAFIRFNQSSKVLYAEPNYKYRFFAIPNDPMFSNLWGFNNTGQTGGIEDADVDAPEAWDFETGSSDVIVAVIDTGIDYTHPDLVKNLWVNRAERDGVPDVDDDGNGYVDDIYGYDFGGAVAADPSDADSDPLDNHFHGTHIAGVIGAVGNNGQGVTGVCWNTKLMTIKIASDDYREVPDVYVSGAVEGIKYAIDNGAKIINASWGGNYFSQSLYDAIREAGDAGVLFVAAAGNDYGSDNDEVPVYPASYDLDNIISVMSSDHNDQKSDFSNFGATSVDIAEPGTDILSTSPMSQNFAMLVFGVPTGYATLSGTSQSAPYASGACALIWSKYPTLAHSIVKGILLKTVDPIFESPRLNLSGGRINLHSALTLIPEGKVGKVLNSKDDPADTSNLYSTIQAAIDDANDGDELIAESNALFLEIIDFKGKAITLRSGDITNPDDPNISPEDTILLGILDEDSVVTFKNNEGPDSVIKGFTISWGNADYGGGIRCSGTSPTITDCIISNNFANFYGAGIDCIDGSPTIKNCTIIDNSTSSNTGIGGGINCEQSSPTIKDCIISNNFADNVGGGIACYNANPTIINCVLANNSAIYLGGGIELEYSTATITNCTIVVDDPNAPKDGGIVAIHDSSPVITNCILWGNGDDLYKCSATYSCIEDNDRGIGNIHSDPLFTNGPLGNYYLNQTAAGQLGSDSPCVNAGDPETDVSLQLDSYTTRTDGVADEGIIDIGAHYTALPAKLIPLNITVVDKNGPVDPNSAKGRVEPGSGTYREYEVVHLEAFPDEGYRVKGWTGTDDDSLTGTTNQITIVANADITIEFEEVPLYQLRTGVVGGRGTLSPSHRRGEYYPEGTVVTLVAAPDQTYIVDRWAGTDDDTSWAISNTVTMDSDKDVTVLFRRPKSLHVPGQYPNINSAVGAAYTHGDKIVVSPGTYSGGIDFQGKALTIASEHPDDPNSVAETIIRVSGFPAFMFQNGEGRDSVVDGFTIQGSGEVILPPPSAGGIGENGANAFGGAITCLNGSSPTLSHLVIRDVVARGQDGEDASFVYPAPPAAPPALEPLPPLEPLPAPGPPDPNDPNQWAPADPNRPEQPTDPNAPIDGIDGADGEPGLPGEPGMDGMDGMPGNSGGNGGVAYGGAMYFDEGSSPRILYCKIINCQSIGGDGGFGGQGQDGQDGQDGQPGQPGQDGQEGGEGLNDGLQGNGGNGGVGGDGGPGGAGGRGGDGGHGGGGGEALGGAIYFGPNCKPVIRFCEILSCSTRQGLGNYGGNAGNGGNGGLGAPGDAGGGGGAGEVDGTDGGDGASGGGGIGGDGGNGADMGVNGIRSWAGAIYYSENCEVEIVDTIISDNAAEIIVPSYTYGGGDGGDGGTGGDPDGDATGGDGGIGGNGGFGGPGAGDPNDPNNVGYGDAGAGGAGGAGGAAGADGLPGMVITSFTPSYGGANYYESGCKVRMTSTTISKNASKQYDGTGHDGGAEYYRSGSEIYLDKCQYIGNLAGFDGSGGAQYFEALCAIEINDCNYVNNSSTGNGGALFVPTDFDLKINDSDFVGNTTTGDFGSGGAIYGGGVWDEDNYLWNNNGVMAIDDSYFSNNQATFGGGLYWHGEDAEISISDSVIINNVAEHGGGMYWSSGAPVITGCSIMGNRAKTSVLVPVTEEELVISILFGTRPYGGGGGLFCWSSEARIENCFISGNSSEGSGGGVYFGGDPSEPLLKNCLVKRNSAVLDGGGIVSYWLTTPTISNCTIVNNRANDPSNVKRGRGGGLSCSYQSHTTVINSILWDNVGMNGNQISIGSDDEPFYLDRPAKLTVSYSDIQGGRSSIYIEPGRILNWLEGNIDADPLFVESHHSLSQIAAGQDVDSPCIDAGSGTVVALGLEEFTTRSDGVPDEGQVDIGLHYTIGEGKYRLIVNVVGENGTVKPRGGIYNKFEVVKLNATIDPGYRVKWVGTDDDSSVALNNTVTMDSNKTITVEFVKYLGKTVTVPGDYQTLQDAVNAAKDGDTIILEPGIHYGGYSSVALAVTKAVTIMSRNPDDPNSVAATIIDGYTTVNDWSYIGVVFTSNVDSRTVLNGITIQNCGGHIADGDDGDRTNLHPNGEDGGSFGGAAIHIQNGASPIIKNCIIRNNIVEAGNGGNGVGADGTNGLNAGRGGWGGWAHGGAIWCGPDSSPKFINCIIENNTARGGNGGNGGDGDGGAEANYGGNWSRSQANNIDPNSLDITFVVGPLWEVWEWDDASEYGEIYDEPNLTSYYGDSRWYSAFGGGAYCDIGSNVTFINCEIRGNTTEGGMSGIGGQLADGGGRNIEPLVSFQLSSYGAGVYCAADSIVTFMDCTFEDNIVSVLPAGITDPNHRLDPYNGYGGGVCAESSAAITFVDCNFVDNQADSGGGIYTDESNVTIVDCNIVSNEALRGGGFVGVDGLINILSSNFTNNRAIDDVNDPNDDIVLTNGAGIYCWLGGINIHDCNISGNIAEYSGGGVYLRDVNTASLVNNLIINNASGRDGGGVSANWFTKSIISNCTFVGNATVGNAGEPNNTGYGGGFYNSYNSDSVVTNSIFWNNFALNGNGIALGSGFEFNKTCGTLSISYSGIKDGRSGVWVDEDCTVNWGDRVLDKDPLFIDGPQGDYYLSQIASGDGQNSPYVDAGSDYSSVLGFLGRTTRRDESSDIGLVDIGYHHPSVEPCRLCDLVLDGVINFRDFAVVADRWLSNSCSSGNNWCSGADLTSDMNIDMRDIAFLADCWLVEDTEAPKPNPGRWDTEPYVSSAGSITMSAKKAIDAWGWNVEYYFESISEGGHDSGWQISPTYTDVGLTPGVEYGYRVKSRDGLGYETKLSVTRYAGLDSIPPAPAPYIEDINALSETSVTMTSSISYDDSGVEYYFQSTSLGGHDSGWQTDPNYVDIDLDPNTEYSYRVKARDGSGFQNETAWSETVVIRTLASVDLIAPDPNPMTWDPTVDPNGFDGTPREVAIDVDGDGTVGIFEYSVQMTASVATDAGGGAVEYYFECTTNSNFSSGWVASEIYIVLVGRTNQGHRFRVKARDQFRNETAWSPELRAVPLP